MNLARLKDTREGNAGRDLSQLRHEGVVEGQHRVADTVITATATLIKYLEGHTSKVDVVNQLKEIGTPDALKIIPEIKALHETLKGHKNTDLSELTKVMQSILSEAQAIPKSLPELERITIPDHSQQFAALTQAVQAVEKVVAAQELVAEAPVVNVASPEVKVEAPDLAPLQASMGQVVEAVKAIVIPEFKTDNKAVETLLTKTTKLLKELVEKPVGGGGGGGGGRVSPYQDSDGLPAFVTLTSAGKLPVDAAASQPSTSSVTSVASADTSTSLLASNANRKQATVFNDSTQVLYLKLGATASSSSFTVKMVAASYYELPTPVYTGAIDGIWAAANGNARITELT